MAGMIKKIRNALSNRTTYRVGMLQTRAYRVLTQRTSVALQPYGITPPEWAMLGMLYDNPDGLRFSMVAEEVGVEAPFVTVMAKKLISKGLIVEKQDSKDSRAKLLCVTTKGKKLVPEIEIHVREAMRSLVEGISRADLLSYASVLHHIAYAESE